jgi:hypothetical protein
VRGQDVIVTWPQSRPLDSYLAELKRAARDGLVINYRVSRLPATKPRRCYMVHSGMVRGWCDVLSVERRGEGDVRRAENDSGFWPGGYYIVRSPVWHALKNPLPMRGFQSWRWYDGSSA